MKYFDLHCDTPYRIYQTDCAFDKNDLHVSLERTEKKFSQYTQLAAYCASSKVSDEEGFATYLRHLDKFDSELKRLCDRASLCVSFDDLKAAEANKKSAIFLAVEDARILADDLSRLDVLYQNGCRFLTMVWGGTSCIGGAHNTSVGLTDFGRSVARKAFELGIITDVSHSSEKTVDELIEISNEVGKPLIATHSNSYSVFPHSRNLRDRHFKEIVNSQGIVGISLCDIHIQPEELGHPNIDSVIRHIDHYLELGGEDTVCMGCDFDGCDLPDGFETVSDVTKLFDRLAQLGYSNELIEKISYQNAREFIKRNL